MDRASDFLSVGEIQENNYIAEQDFYLKPPGRRFALRFYTSGLSDGQSEIAFALKSFRAHLFDRFSAFFRLILFQNRTESVVGSYPSGLRFESYLANKNRENSSFHNKNGTILFLSHQVT